MQKIIKVFTLMLGILSAPCVANNTVKGIGSTENSCLENNISQRVESDSIEIKLQADFAKLKAFKAPFERLSGWKPIIFFSLVGGALAFYTYFETDINSYLYFKYKNDMELESDFGKKRALMNLMNYTGGMAQKFYEFFKLSLGICSIPWVAAAINKWLDFSCQSYERDLKKFKKI